MPYLGSCYLGDFYLGVDPCVSAAITGIATTPIEGAPPATGTGARIRDAEVVHRLLHVDGTPYEVTDVDGNGTGLVIVGGSLTETAHAIPRMEGRIRISNPEGAAYGLFEQGDVLLVEKRLTFPDGQTYGYSYGRLGVTAVRETTESRPESFAQELELEVIQQAEILLDFSVKGDLPVLALPVAHTIGLVAPSGDVASVEAIMAYLLIEGGAAGIGIQGTIRPTQPDTSRFGAVRISPFVITPETPARDVMRRCHALTGVTYWVDWDGTAVLTAAPTSVLDLMQAAPKRTFSSSDPDNAVANRVEPSPGITKRQLAILQQSSTGTVREVVYTVAEGSGMPQLGSPGATSHGQYRRVDASAFPPPSLDPLDKQDERTRQLVLLESLRGNEIDLAIVPDPWFRAGDTAILQFPEYDLADALAWCHRKVDDLGMGEDRVELQRLFEPNAPTADVGTGVPAFSISVGLGFNNVGIQGPNRADLYNVTPSTYEGWIKLDAWPQRAGANLPAVLFHTTATAVYLSGGTAGSTCNVAVRVYNDAGTVVATLPTFAQAVNDAAWHHWALQREADWCGLFIDGALKASATGSFALVAPPQTNLTSHLGWQAVGGITRDLIAPDPILAPDVEGRFALYSWRFSRRAVYARTGFTALATDFRANTYSDYPTVLSCWPLLQLTEVRVSAGDEGTSLAAWSSTSELYCYVFSPAALGTPVQPPFPV